MLGIRQLFNSKKTADNHFIFSSKEDTEKVFYENFKANGGYLVPCENESQALLELKNLIQKLCIENVLCFDERYKGHLNVINQNHNEDHLFKGNDCFFMPCEFLIAFDGNIMVSSDQIGLHKPVNLPRKIIMIAHKKQIKESSSEALTSLGVMKRNNLPSNITVIRGKNSNNFGIETNVKDIYLLFINSDN